MKPAPGEVRPEEQAGAAEHENTGRIGDPRQRDQRGGCEPKTPPRRDPDADEEAPGDQHRLQHVQARARRLDGERQVLNEQQRPLPMHRHPEQGEKNLDGAGAGVAEQPADGFEVLREPGKSQEGQDQKAARNFFEKRGLECIEKRNPAGGKEQRRRSCPL